MKTGLELIAQEREEQIVKHNHSTKTDFHLYKNGELKLLAEYLMKDDNDAEADELREVLINGDAGIAFTETFIGKLDSKPTIEKLTIAGALLAAEIDMIIYYNSSN